MITKSSPPVGEASFVCRVIGLFIYHLSAINYNLCLSLFTFFFKIGDGDAAGFELGDDLAIVLIAEFHYGVIRLGPHGHPVFIFLDK